MTLFESHADSDDYDIEPARQLRGRVESLAATPGEGFETARVPRLDLTFEGIPGDRHGGTTRPSGGREPWYSRGTEMRNERQLSLLCPWELNRIARGMDIVELSPHWIGSNIVLSGFTDFSMLPAGTLLFFDGGVTLKVDGQNAPCRIAGSAIQQRYPDRSGLDLLFPKVAKRLRGLVAWVEKPGTLEEGAEVTARLPEQWIYRG